MVFGIYCRKSVLTDKGESVENQLEMCRDYIHSRFGMENKIVIYEDEGYSGKNTARPMFIKLTADIKDKKLDYVVCYRLDRMSRSVSDFSALVEMMNRNKTGFICIKEEFDTSKPMGKAMMYIASVFSQLERETIGERVRDNMLMLAKNGRWLGGNTPMGYDSVKEHYTCGDGRTKYACFLKHNEDMARVKKIFDVFIKTGSPTKTADIINSMGMRTKNGLKFTALAVKDIISNPVYCTADKEAFNYFENKGIKVNGDISKNGLISYNKNNGKNVILAVGKHRPAIEGILWVEAQNILRESGVIQRGLIRGEALASGSVICGKCGERMYAVKRSGNRGFDYICRGKRKKKACTCKNLNGNRADEQIKMYLREKNDLFFMKKEVRDRLAIVWDGDELKISESAEKKSERNQS